MAREVLEAGYLLNERYRIIRVIGKGGMGTVYQAEHIRLDTILAVKEIRAQAGSEEDELAMLEQCEQEARFLVRLNHPNLPKVTDAFTDHDRFFLVMEYIDGVTLDHKQRGAGKTGLNPAQVVEWALQIADVLAYLHSQQPPIIFRDLKPANVMVQQDGLIRLIDFGIARRFQPGASKDTSLLGSVGYSPPEQFGKHQTDHRSDIYSFGATLHHLLTGKDPSHSPFKFESVSKLNPAVPEALSVLIQRCTKLDAEDRPTNIHEVALELLAVRDSMPFVSYSSPLTGATGVGDSPSTPLTGSTPSSRVIMTQGTSSGRTPSQKVIAPSGKTTSGSFSADPLTSPLIGYSEHKKFIVPIVIASILGIAVVGVAFTKMVGKTPSDQSESSKNTKLKPLPPIENKPVEANPEVAKPGDPTLPVAPQNTKPEERSVIFTGAQVQDVTSDSNGVPVLRLSFAGSMKGKSGAGTLAVFFYDGEGNPALAANAQGDYASKGERSGQLSMSQNVSFSGDGQAFQAALDIPLREFPGSLPNALQFRGVVFFDNLRSGESPLTQVPQNALTLMTGQTGAGVGSTPSSGSAPGSPPPPNGGQQPPASNSNRLRGGSVIGG